VRRWARERPPGQSRAASAAEPRWSGGTGRGSALAAASRSAAARGRRATVCPPRRPRAGPARR